jgi:predicted nucleic acid-binding protein
VIVADTNLVVYLYVHGQRTRAAESVLSRDAAWAAPLLWRSEFRNTLTGLVRRQALAVEDATRIAHEAERLMAGREYSVVSHDVLQLAAGSRCSAYDCEFVSLAQELAVPLITSDRALLRAFPRNTVLPEAFVSR